MAGKLFPVVNLKPEQIRTDSDNVFSHKPEELERLRTVIRAHGNLSTMVVDADSKDKIKTEDGRTVDSYQLVGGEARLHAYIQEGFEEVPVMLATFASRAQKRAAAIALNAPYGSFDTGALNLTMKELHLQEISLNLTGLEECLWRGAIEVPTPSTSTPAHTPSSPTVRAGTETMRMVTIPIRAEAYEEWRRRVQRLGDSLGTVGITNTVLTALDVAFKAHGID
jgi:hypothetical protein